MKFTTKWAIALITAAMITIAIKLTLPQYSSVAETAVIFFLGIAYSVLLSNYRKLSEQYDNLSSKYLDKVSEVKQLTEAMFNSRKTFDSKSMLKDDNAIFRVYFKTILKILMIDTKSTFSIDDVIPLMITECEDSNLTLKETLIVHTQIMKNAQEDVYRIMLADAFIKKDYDIVKKGMMEIGNNSFINFIISAELDNQPNKIELMRQVAVAAFTPVYNKITEVGLKDNFIEEINNKLKS